MKQIKEEYLLKLIETGALESQMFNAFYGLKSVNMCIPRISIFVPPIEAPKAEYHIARSLRSSLALLSMLAVPHISCRSCAHLNMHYTSLRSAHSASLRSAHFCTELVHILAHFDKCSTPHCVRLIC